MESSQAVKGANITDIVQKFARVCRLRSIGVFSEENQRPSSENSSDVTAVSKETDDTENESQKVYPQPSDEKNPKSEALETLISKLFANISALKAAYVELQAAHTPYDPEKIQKADMAVIQQLKNLSELKHSYREKEKPPSYSDEDSHLLAEIQEQQSMLKTYEVMVKKFKAQIESRDLELEKLREELREATEKKGKLEKMLRQKSFKDAVGYVSNESLTLTPQFFISTVQAAAKAAEEGIAHYNNLINELLKNGIEPFVTLFHWDTPQTLEYEYGGFRSKKVVEDFGIFAEECFRSFGDRVKYWITINEPFTTCYLGYDVGILAPGRCSPGFGNCTAGNSATEPYIVAHNMLLAHNAAVKIYRHTYQGKQKGSIGMALMANWMVPFTKSLLDQQATQRAIDFRIGWFLDPLTSGKYPDSMRILVGPRLPQFTIEEAKELKGSFDFIALNYYSTDFTIDNPNPPNPVNTDYILDARANVTYEVNGVYIGSAEGLSEFRSYPAGLRDVVSYTKHRYNNPPIYITETGYGDFDNGTTPLERALNDSKRVKYHYEYLSSLLQAIREGADVRGYVAWSLLDSLEWSNGYNYRFGLHYVDYHDNLKRYPRASAHWFKTILRL